MRRIAGAFHSLTCSVVAATLLLGMLGYLPDAWGAFTCQDDKCTCDGATVLPPEDHHMQDLEVTGKCTVKQGGVYAFRNVNVYNAKLPFSALEPCDSGPALIFEDGSEIHFWARSVVVENNACLSAGATEPIGTMGGALTIHLYGGTPTTEAEKVRCKTPQDSRRMFMDCGVPTKIWNSRAADPVDLPGGVRDFFYQYQGLGQDVDTGSKAYFGTKVLAVSFGGTLELFGNKGATYDEDVDADPSHSGKSWVRLDGTLLPGAKQLKVHRDVDWKRDDRIVVTTTDYLPGHSEELQITERVNARTFEFERVDPNTQMKTGEGVQYIHNGEPYHFCGVEHGKRACDAPDGIEQLKLDIGKSAETRAVVALLTRDIRVVSADDAFPADNMEKQKCRYNCFPEPPKEPTATPCIQPRGAYCFGGHTMLRQGFLRYQVQGVEFFQLGQGGRLMHYPVHFHLARKTPENTFVKDSSVHDSMTRCYVVHGTHGVTLQRNVGYRSIGHCIYIEDGTEIDNKFYSNIGIFARAAIANRHNPRRVPGILARGNLGAANVPFNSDFANPAVFWIMNGWNDFEGNMAAGASACGICYWLLGGVNSGASREMKWDSYASTQATFGRSGAAPLKLFRDNYCSSAMMSFNTVGATDTCIGLAQLNPIENTLAPLPPDPNYYPTVDIGNRHATLCPTTCSNNRTMACSAAAECGMGASCDTRYDCSQVNLCAADNRDHCPVTVLDRYTSSFHWPQQNFAAIWLRPQWYLVINSVLTDSQNGGLGFVTGGDYTHSSVTPGNWQIASKSVFVGHTQNQAGICSNDPNEMCVNNQDCGMDGATCEDFNPLASDAGPFNPLEAGNIKGLTCDNPEANHCRSNDEGITVPIVDWAVNQRLFNIYDGPPQQDANAYLDINPTPLGPQCRPKGCQNPGPHGCCPERGPNNDGMNAWMYTRTLGIPVDGETGRCVLPNAAIGWKQPNGFYYPPSFHSDKLYFDNVGIRHYVLQPLWKPGTHETDQQKYEEAYCSRTAQQNVFSTDFTDVDRQTVLNDDDGSLTGLLSPAMPAMGETISVNVDTFFNAPVEAPECRSFVPKVGAAPNAKSTAKTSPYEYLTTAVYPKCVVDGDCGGHCAASNSACANTANCTPNICTNGQCTFGGPCQGTPDCTTNQCMNSDWGMDCTNTSCYGVPLFRQLLTQADVDTNNPVTEGIRMSGMAFSQRSMLTANNGVYYIDTGVSKEEQQKSATNLNVFRKGGTYYVFFVYANERTKQTYEIYVGPGISSRVIASCQQSIDNCALVEPVRVNISTGNLEFFPRMDNPPGIAIEAYDTVKGILTVGVDFTAQVFVDKFRAASEDYCQPESFCAPNPNNNDNCETTLPESDPLHADAQRICQRWAPPRQVPSEIGDIDCPLDGCLGFSVRLLSDQFATCPAGGDPHCRRPVPQAAENCFPEMPPSPWNVDMTSPGNNVAGECKDAVNDVTMQFCAQ